jgi:DNA primase
MDIQVIKQQLSLSQLLDHYGLKPDKNHRLHCPWHDDKTPSLQLYPDWV